MNHKFSARRLNRASKHVSSLWFPINPEVVGAIRKKAREGDYVANPNEIFEDLKQDFALFTFIVKELTVLASKSSIDPRTINDPVRLISWAGPLMILDLIKDDSRLPQSHILQSSSKLQASRLRETAIVASTAEVLSAQSDLSPETGFSRGVIRQTGLNLIAWNYPSLYSRIVKGLKSGQSLDDALAQELGFSPVTLAMRVLQPELTADLNARPASDFYDWESYDRLCEIGAALARADNPETYPSAENDWRMANEYLQKTVGADGINIIRNKAAEYARDYKRTLSSLFQSPRELNPERSIERFKEQPKEPINRYIQQCSKEIQKLLEALYSQLAKSTSSEEALETLIRTIIPEAGFTGGCVYLLDPSAFALMPRTIFGTVKLRQLDRVQLNHPFNQQKIDETFFNHSDPTCDLDLAATALSCAQPVVERHEEMQDIAMKGMYASLGDNKKVGVLYLEAPDDLDAQSDFKTLCTFKAMRQALADALELE